MTPVKPPDLPDLPDLPKLAEVTEQANQVAALHVERDGMCEGCLSVWARLAPYPCQRMLWARAWLADPAHGGGQSTAGPATGT